MDLSLDAAAGRHDAAASDDGRVRTRWRIAERVLSIAVGGAAISGAVYLGVTGPLLSPVTPPAAADAAAGATTQTVPADGANGGTDGTALGRHGRHGDDHGR